MCLQCKAIVVISMCLLLWVGQRCPSLMNYDEFSEDTQEVAAVFMLFFFLSDLLSFPIVGRFRGCSRLTCLFPAIIKV